MTEVIAVHEPRIECLECHVFQAEEEFAIVFPKVAPGKKRPTKPKRTNVCNTCQKLYKKDGQVRREADTKALAFQKLNRVLKQKSGAGIDAQMVIAEFMEQGGGLKKWVEMYIDNLNAAIANGKGSKIVMDAFKLILLSLPMANNAHPSDEMTEEEAAEILAQAMGQATHDVEEEIARIEKKANPKKLAE